MLRMAIKDKNGNNFCSDIIKIYHKNIRIKILKELGNTINEDCIDEFVTHTIQNFIEFAFSEEKFKNIIYKIFNYIKIKN